MEEGAGFRASQTSTGVGNAQTNLVKVRVVLGPPAQLLLPGAKVGPEHLPFQPVPRGCRLESHALASRLPRALPSTLCHLPEKWTEPLTFTECFLTLGHCPQLFAHITSSNPHSDL